MKHANNAEIKHMHTMTIITTLSLSDGSVQHTIDNGIEITAKLRMDKF